jgi:hypothetical protein
VSILTFTRSHLATVDREIEKCAIPQSTFTIKEEADCQNCRGFSVLFAPTF